MRHTVCDDASLPAAFIRLLLIMSDYRPSSSVGSRDASNGKGLPVRGSFIGRLVGKVGLWLLGWRVIGALPNVPKVVAIAFPHTSNWDFVVGLLVMLATDLRASWLGKAEMFGWPLGWLWRRLGGVAVVRGQQRGGVQQQVEVVQRAEQIFLLIEPEGTRRAESGWKRGFYHIAEGAGVPILPVTWDFPSKTLRFWSLFEPTGDVDADVRQLMLIGRDCRGRHPEKSPWQKDL